MRTSCIEPETLTAIHRAEHDARWAPQISVMSDSDRGYRTHKQNGLLIAFPPINPESRIIVNQHGVIIRRGKNMPPPAKHLIFAETGTANNSRSQTDDGVK